MVAPAPIYLIDASIYIFRAYFSLPERWHSPEGYPLNAVYGYTSFLLDLVQELRELSQGRAIDCAAAFDESLGSCYRNQLYPDYKSSRELPDEALAYQLDACRRITEILEIPCYGTGTMRCFVNYTVETGDGYVRGNEVVGASWNYETAIDMAVANVAVGVLNDEKILNYLEKQVKK